MINTTITLRKIWPPRVGSSSKNVSIEDDNGGRWKIHLEKAATLTEGRTYKIGYTNESFSGVDYKQIKSILEMGGGTPATNGAAPLATKTGNGPEHGMWCKMAMELLSQGVTEKLLYEYAKIAREFAQCQLLAMDGPPKAPPSAGPFPENDLYLSEDGLEETFK